MDKKIKIGKNGKNVISFVVIAAIRPNRIPNPIIPNQNVGKNHLYQNVNFEEIFFI